MRAILSKSVAMQSWLRLPNWEETCEISITNLTIKYAY